MNDVPDALLRVVRRYQAERRAGEPFHLWARRVPMADELTVARLDRVAAQAVTLVKRYRIREEMNGIAEPPGKIWFWELEAGRHRRRPLHPVRDVRGRLPVELHRRRRGHRPARAGQDVHRLLAVLGLLPPGRPALRGAVAAVDRGPPTRTAEVQPAQVRADSVRHLLEDHRRPPGGRARRGGGQPTPCGPARGIDDVQDGGAVQRAADRAAGRRARSTAPWCPSRATIPTSSGRASPPSPPRPRRSAPPRAASTTRPWRWPSSTCPATTCPAKPRIAVVGTPCEVQGLRAMQARRWPTGAHRVDAVVLTIALMCTKNFDYEALTLRELRDKRGVDLDRVSKMDVIRGRMIVEYRDGELAVDEPVKDFHGAALKGCDECADFLGRSADISVGSVGSMDGWTSVLVRTERGRAGLPGGPGEARRPRARRPRGAAPARRARQEDRRPDAAAQARPRRAAVHRLRRARARLRGHRPPARLHPPLSVAARPRAARSRRAHGSGRGLAGRGPRRAGPGRGACATTGGVSAWLWSPLAGAGARRGSTEAEFEADRARATGARSGSGWPVSGPGRSAAPA